MSDEPKTVHDRILDIEHGRHTADFMELTPNGVLAYMVREHDAKVMALLDLRQSVLSDLDRIADALEATKRAAAEFRAGLEKLNV